jgi:hypothetical protein
MSSLIRRKTTILPLLIAGVLACSGLLPKAEAVVPPPDGGYPGGNTAEGDDVLLSLTTGDFNTAVGWRSLRSVTDGTYNTAIGAGTLLANTGDKNTATGAGALFNNTTGEQNTAIGTFALLSNTEGVGNTATGFSALQNNRGNANTANGANALFTNTTGHGNTATGFEALTSNTRGYDNTATGVGALHNNTTGFFNTANGSSALYRNTTGYYNTAIGTNAMVNATGGTFNTAVGQGALVSNTTGSGNVALGFVAGNAVTTAHNVICIDAAGENVSDRCYIRNIRGVAVGNGDGINVIIDSDGQLGTNNSSRRFKKDIRPMDQTSEAILALKPVTFHYKNQDTKTAEDAPQFGLIAEDVAEINPGLVVRDAEGEPLAVRYDAVNAMLLNEFLKEHQTVQELKSAAAKQKATIAEQQKQIQALTAGLQKVNDELEMRRPSPQTVANNQ